MKKQEMVTVVIESKDIMPLILAAVGAVGGKQILGCQIETINMGNDLIEDERGIRYVGRIQSPLAILKNEPAIQITLNVKVETELDKPQPSKVEAEGEQAADEAQSEIVVLSRNFDNEKRGGKYSVASSRGHGAAKVVALRNASVNDTSSSVLSEDHKAKFNSFACGVVIQGLNIDKHELPRDFDKRKKEIVFNGSGFEYKLGKTEVKYFDYLLANDDGIFVA